MASNDLFLRSDADKGETSVDNDLRLRSDTDKTTVTGAGTRRMRQMKSLIKSRRRRKC